MAWWNRPSAEEIAEKAVEKALAAVNTPRGLVTLPQGTKTLTQSQAITVGQGLGTQESPLPRNPMDGQVAFGPATPLIPRPLDPNGPWGRPEPRRTEYQITWNLQISNLRAVPWEVLRSAADQCDVVRRCIDIRKDGIKEQAWDIALTPEATARLMQDDQTIKSPQKAQMIGRQKYQPIIDRIREFLEEPDAQNGEDWSTWIGNVLEERYVWDALSIWPVFQNRRQYLTQTPAAFRVLDGSTIKPLLDEYGNRPAPPFPAFQQILYGFPRGEFVAAPDPDGAFTADQLFYAPSDVRSGGTWPYGCSATEKSLPAATLWIERQRWWREEWESGVVGRADVLTDAAFTAADRQQLESLYNDEMSGNTRRRQQYKLWPLGFKPEYPHQLAEKYKPDLDEFLIKQIGSKFAVMPTQLGIIPQAYGIMGRGGQPGEQDISETEGDAPLEEWLIDTVNKLCRRYLGMPKDLTLTFTGGGIDEDAQVRAQTDQVLINSAQKTVNDVRAENGDSLYEFPEANMPFVMTASGPQFLEGASEPDPVPVIGPDGQPVAPPANAKKPAANAKPSIDGKKPAPKDAPSNAEVRVHKAAEADAFLSFARNRQGRAWRDFEFKTLEPDLAKALNAAGASGDYEAAKTLVATVPKALAATEPPEPSDPEEQLRSGALLWALAREGIRLKDVPHSVVIEIGNRLADGMAAGESTDVIAASIAPLLGGDLKRAELIARTETARATEGAVWAYAKETGGLDKSWLDDETACPICKANTAQGSIPLTRPFQGGVLFPPQHPSCRCALALTEKH